MNNTKELAIRIACTNLDQGLRVQAAFLDILSNAEIDSVISISIHPHTPPAGTTAAVVAPTVGTPKLPEGQDDTPDFVESWDTTVVQRSSELPAGEGKPLPASTDILEASHRIAEQYLESLISAYTLDVVADSLVKKLGSAYIEQSDDLNYYIKAIDDLHAIELRENNKLGLKHTDDAIYEALKAEHSYAVKTLRM